MNRTIVAIAISGLVLLAPILAYASVSLATPNTSVLTTGLMGYWPLDGNTTSWTTGTTADVSGNGITATMVSMSTTSSPVAGVIGQALQFNGSDHVQTGVFGSVPTSISEVVWIKPSSAGGVVVDEEGLGGTWHDSQIEVETGNSIKVCVWIGTGSGCVVAATGITYGKWYQVALVYNSSTSILQSYVNGILTASASEARSDPGSGLYYGIGQSDLTNAGNGAGFSGSVDDVRIYNRALSAQEVALLYALGTIHTGNTPATNSSFSIDQGGLNSGLVGYWSMDGNTINWTANTMKDLSGNGNTATLENMGPSYSPVAGKIGQAFEFYGVGSYTYITLGSSTALNPAQFTIAAWVDPNDLGSSYNWIFSNSRDCCGSPYNGIGFELDDGGYVGGVIWNTSPTYVEGATAAPANAWSYAVFTYDGSTMKVYFDGKLDGSAAYTGGVGQPASFADTIGTLGYNPGQFTFSGAIDDVRLYNRPLSAQEIASLYTAGEVNIGHSNTTSNTGINSGLVGYWTFDGPTINWRADTVADVSGNSNTGTLENMSTSSSPVAGKIGQALKFNGSTQGIAILSPANLALTALTISAWIDPSSFNTNESIFDAGFHGYQLAISGSKVQFSKDGSVVILNGATTLATQKWYHIVVTYDGTNAKIYVNGNLDSSGSSAQTFTSPTAPVIGNNYASNQNFPGTIDDVRVYGRVLSTQEIQQLYQMGR